MTQDTTVKTTETTVTNTSTVPSAAEQIEATAEMALKLQKPNILISDILDVWFAEYFKPSAGGTTIDDGRHIIGDRADFVVAERQRVSDAVAILKCKLSAL